MHATGCRDRRPSPAVGEAIYQLAELDRLRGAFESAEAGYREAGSWGRLPEPGLALLRLAQGDVGAAATAIRRAMAEAADDLVASRLLEPAVEIALAAGDVVTAARSGRSTRRELADALDAPLLRAMALASRGRGPPGGRRRRGRAGRPPPGMGGVARRSMPRTRRPGSGS